MDTFRKIVLFLVVIVIYNLTSIAKDKILKRQPQISKSALYGGNVILFIIGLGYILG